MGGDIGTVSTSQSTKVTRLCVCAYESGHGRVTRAHWSSRLSKFLLQLAPISTPPPPLETYCWFSFSPLPLISCEVLYIGCAPLPVSLFPIEQKLVGACVKSPACLGERGTRLYINIGY